MEEQKVDQVLSSVNDTESLNEAAAESTIDPEAEVFADFAPGPVWHISVLSGVLIFLIIVYKVYFAFFAS